MNIIWSTHWQLNCYLVTNFKQWTFRLHHQIQIFFVTYVFTSCLNLQYLNYRWYKKGTESAYIFSIIVKTVFSFAQFPLKSHNNVTYLLFNFIMANTITFVVSVTRCYNKLNKSSQNQQFECTRWSTSVMPCLLHNCQELGWCAETYIIHVYMCLENIFQRYFIHQIIMLINNTRKTVYTNLLGDEISYKKNKNKYNRKIVFSFKIHLP